MKLNRTGAPDRASDGHRIVGDRVVRTGSVLRTRATLRALTLALALLTVLSPTSAWAAIQQILAPTGDDLGNDADTPYGIAWDPIENRAIVTSYMSTTVFEVEALSGTPLTRLLMDASGDGTNALDSPWDVVVAPDGTIYVSGDLSHNVFKLARGIVPGNPPVITQIVDTTGAGSGKNLLSPRGLAVAADGTLYVAGFNTNNVLAVSPGGVVTEIMDATGDGDGNGLSGPMDIVINKFDDVFVSGHISNNVFKIEPNGTITEVIDSTGDTAGNPLTRPWGLAVNTRGDLFVAGHFSDNVLEYSVSGFKRQVLGSVGAAGHALVAPVGLSPVSDGGVYVASSITDVVFKIEPFQSPTIVVMDETGDGLGNELVGPWAVATNGVGGVLVTGAFSNNAFQGDPPQAVLLPGLLAPGASLLAALMMGAGALRLRRAGSDESSRQI